MLKYHCCSSSTCMIRIMLEEILAFVKLPKNTKANALLFGVLAVFAIFFAVNGSSSSSIASNNILTLQQASASTNDLGSSLSNIIKDKVSDAIDKSFNHQTQSGIDQQSSTSTTNQQSSTRQSSINGANKSTNLNCTNGKCITTTCTDNNCTTTIQNSDSGSSSSAASSATPKITTITI